MYKSSSASSSSANRSGPSPGIEKKKPIFGKGRVVVSGNVPSISSSSLCHNNDNSNEYQKVPSMPINAFVDDSTDYATNAIPFGNGMTKGGRTLVRGKWNASSGDVGNV